MGLLIDQPAGLPVMGLMMIQHAIFSEIVKQKSSHQSRGRGQPLKYKEEIQNIRVLPKTDSRRCYTNVKWPQGA